MKAKSEIKKIWRQRIRVTPEAKQELMKRFNIAESTLLACLNISPVCTKKKTIDVQVAAINEYGGIVETFPVFNKPTLVLIREEDEENEAVASAE